MSEAVKFGIFDFLIFMGAWALGYAGAVFIRAVEYKRETTDKEPTLLSIYIITAVEIIQSIIMILATFGLVLSGYDIYKLIRYKHSIYLTASALSYIKPVAIASLILNIIAYKASNVFLRINNEIDVINEKGEQNGK